MLEIILWFFMSSVRVPSTQEELAKSSRRLEAAVQMTSGLYDNRRAKSALGTISTNDLLTIDFCIYCSSVWESNKGARLCLAKYVTKIMEGGEEVVYYQNSNVETGELDSSFQAQLALAGEVRQKNSSWRSSPKVLSP
eukprot:GHVP01044532.1.p1 GENE.GHVP01044532.1~~GHVP01044532.1.p1  ORF type:complete len:138 (+),score=15.42 GHVP01044532.1:574-987(+)